MPDESNTQGRNALRRDTEVVVEAFDRPGATEHRSVQESRMTRKPKIVKLGEVYLRCTIDLIDFFIQHGRRPILKEDRDEIIARHSSSPGATIMNQLENKYGVLYTEDEGSEIDKTCRMIIEIILVKFQRGAADEDLIVHYPHEHKGKRLGDLKQELGLNGDMPIEGDEGESQGEPETVHSGIPTYAANAQPIALRGQRHHGYTLIKNEARERSGRPFSPSELEQVLEATGSKSVRSLISWLEKTGFLHVVSGEKRSRTNPSMRVVVFRPTMNENETLIVPPECLPSEGDAQQEEEVEGPKVLTLPADTEPLVLRGLKIPGYKVLLELLRGVDYEPVSSQQIKNALSPTGVSNPFSLLNSLAADDLCEVVSGEVGSKHNPPMRLFRFRPFQEGDDGKVVVPPECQEPEPVISEPIDAEESLPVEPEEVLEQEEVEVPVVVPGVSRTQIEARLQAAEQSVETLMDKAREGVLTPYQDKIAALSAEEAELEARLEQIRAEAEELATELQARAAQLDREDLQIEGLDEARAELKKCQEALELFDKLKDLLGH